MVNHFNLILVSPSQETTQYETTAAESAEAVVESATIEQLIHRKSLAAANHNLSERELYNGSVKVVRFAHQSSDSQQVQLVRCP